MGLNPADQAGDEYASAQSLVGAAAVVAAAAVASQSSQQARAVLNPCAAACAAHVALPVCSAQCAVAAAAQTPAGVAPLLHPGAVRQMLGHAQEFAAPEPTHVVAEMGQAPPAVGPDRPAAHLGEAEMADLAASPSLGLAAAVSAAAAVAAAGLGKQLLAAAVAAVMLAEREKR